VAGVSGSHCGLDWGLKCVVFPLSPPLFLLIGLGECDALAGRVDADTGEAAGAGAGAGDCLRRS